MTEQSMFFSDGSYYSQNVFARFIKDIFGHDGVVTGIDNELEVTANTPTNMAVNVNTGRSYIKGYFHEILTDAVSLTIPDADETNDRIDRIILRLDVDSERKISACVLEGTPAASPVAPTLTQTSTIWEISLAQVYVSANATSIATSNLTDERTYMWMNRDNMPKASKTEFGSVKISDGFIVEDGVISMDAVDSVLITNLSSTNSSGFKIGEVTATIASFSGSISIPGGGTATYNIGSAYAPLSSRTKTMCPPFTTRKNTTATITATCTATNVGGISYQTTWTFKGIRVSDSEVLGTVYVTLGNVAGNTSTGTLTATLPDDWDDSSDTLQWKVVAPTTSDTASMSVSVATSSYSGTIYYNPVAGS